MALSLRILLVEDHPIVGELTAELLRQNGQQVEIARTGAEGQRKAIKAPPDVVICDLRLPDRDGFDVVRAIRDELAPNPPLMIGMTAADVTYLQRRVQQTAFDVFLSKPLVWKSFQERVESLTAKRE